MIVLTYKKYSIRVYFNQLNGSLFFNGKPINSLSTKNKIYKKFLNILKISINISINKKQTKRKHINDKILLNILEHIDKKFKNKELVFRKIKIDNFINDSPQNKTGKTYNNKYFITLLFILLTLISIFIIDYKSIETKINQNNYLEIKQLESDYKINKCNTHGELSLLKQKCELMLTKIEILKKKTPTVISVFIIWIMDIGNTYFNTFNFINCIITIFIILIIYLFIK